jgi:hypothetical protein
MLHDETYRQWVAKSWPDSFYEGKWEQGGKIRFIGPEGSGTLAELVEVKPYQKIFARHVAVLGPDGSEDRTSEIAKGWVGITEEYTFTEHQGKTTVKVSIETNPAWRKMFDDGWPDALKELKKITERELAGQVAR